MKNLIPQKHYKVFLNEVISAVKNSRYKVYQSVNRHLVELYWSIGKQLQEKIEVANWGESVVEKLSLDLQREFSGMKGFSERNLWNMKQYTEKKNISYEEYKGLQGFGVIKLPETAKNIDWFYYGARDTGYKFIQAKVKREDINLEEIVRDFEFYHVSTPLVLKNVYFKMKAFEGWFIHYHRKDRIPMGKVNCLIKKM